MEESGILEKITSSGSCYLALNQVGLPVEIAGIRRLHGQPRPIEVRRRHLVN
jgi:hypothetical protein